MHWPSLHQLPVSKQIVDDWESILDNTNLKERNYHEFLNKTSGLFLTDVNSYIAISKLKLGSDHETDFVIAKDGFSDGTRYELVEIETPHTALFDKRGNPTAALNSSLQQIRDWRRWLGNNRSMFRKALPTLNTRLMNDSLLNFKIVIGRRTTDSSVIERRNQIAYENRVEIVSFDRLTDHFKRREFCYSGWLESGNEDDEVELANPFAISLSDSQWRSICKKASFHINSHLIDDLKRVRAYNKYHELFIQQQRDNSL